jgi:hypothetical protein
LPQATLTLATSASAYTPASSHAGAQNIALAQPQPQVQQPVYGRHLTPYITDRFQKLPLAQVLTRVPTYGQVVQSNKAQEYVFIWSTKSVRCLLSLWHNLIV